MLPKISILGNAPRVRTLPKSMPPRLTALFSVFICGFIIAAEPFVEKQDLFTVGDDPAYNIYHIPGIVVTAKGTVLAWCEARKGGGDWSDIRILLRRSTAVCKTSASPPSANTSPM